MVSFPIAFEIGDNRDKLTNYFNWLAGVYPAMEEQFQECLLILKSKGILCKDAIWKREMALVKVQQERQE